MAVVEFLLSVSPVYVSVVSEALLPHIFIFASPIRCNFPLRFSSSTLALISRSHACICVQFCLRMEIPPDVVYFFYVRGDFVYSPFLQDRSTIPYTLLSSK